jgi:hypothetical protein
MSNRLHLATRKGLFTLERSSQSAEADWQIFKVDFLGEPVTMSLADPRDGALYAALDLGHFGVKLHRSEDDGESWEEIAVPVYPEGETVGCPPSPGNEHPTGEPKPASLSYLWALESGGPDQPELLWGCPIDC